MTPTGKLSEKYPSRLRDRQYNEMREDLQNLEAEVERLRPLKEMLELNDSEKVSRGGFIATDKDAAFLNLYRRLEKTVARAEVAEKVIAEDRRDYVCGELHHQCAFEGRALGAEARVEAAKELIKIWRYEGKVPLTEKAAFGHLFADELEAALGVSGAEETYSEEMKQRIRDGLESVRTKPLKPFNPVRRGTEGEGRGK